MELLNQYAEALVVTVLRPELGRFKIDILE
jgi:hypothetical protein